MPGIESNAVEPTKDELRGLTSGQKLVRLIPTYGLVILMFGLILFFSVLLPTTFPTLLNLRSILSDKAIIALLSLAAMIPMVAGRIDLTVGYGIVLWHILADHRNHRPHALLFLATHHLHHPRQMRIRLVIQPPRLPHHHLTLGLRNLRRAPQHP